MLAWLAIGDCTIWTGQSTSRVDLDCCVFKDNLFIVYTDSNSDQLWVTWSSDLANWQYKQIAQSAYGVSLTAMSGNMYMAYSSSNRSHMMWPITSNGTDWEFKGQIGVEDTNCTTALLTQGDVVRCIFSSSTGSPDLLETSYTEAAGWAGSSWSISGRCCGGRFRKAFDGI